MCQSLSFTYKAVLVVNPLAALEVHQSPSSKRITAEEMDVPTSTGYAAFIPDLHKILWIARIEATEDLEYADVHVCARCSLFYNQMTLHPTLNFLCSTITGVECQT
jgi:hypothetical protein